jgi:hypothetical protein
MPQNDDKVGEMEIALKHGEDAVVTHLDAAKVMQPGVGTLIFPVFAVARSFRLSSKHDSGTSAAI